MKKKRCFESYEVIIERGEESDGFCDEQSEEVLPQRAHL